MVPTLDSILNDMTRIKPLDQSLAHGKRSMNVTDSYSVERPDRLGRGARRTEAQRMADGARGPCGCPA